MSVGVVEPLVKLVEAGPEGKAGQDSDSFKAEMVQQLLTLQVSHPQLREAIQEASLLACSRPEHEAHHSRHADCVSALLHVAGPSDAPLLFWGQAVLQ